MSLGEWVCVYESVSEKVCVCVREKVRVYVRKSVCECMCDWVCEKVCVCVCVCVWPYVIWIIFSGKSELSHKCSTALDGTGWLAGWGEWSAFEMTSELMWSVVFSARCCHSPVYKTRVMAARALQPLISHDHVTSTLVQLSATLPVTAMQLVSQNTLHGTLLQVGTPL